MADLNKKRTLIQTINNQLAPNSLEESVVSPDEEEAEPESDNYKLKKSKLAAAALGLSTPSEPKKEEPKKPEPAKQSVLTPDQAKDRKALTQAGVKVSNISDTVKSGDLSTREGVKDALSEYKATLGSIDKEAEKRYVDLANQIDAALKDKQNVRDRNDLLQIASLLVDSLVKGGAAMYGLKHGVNMSGVAAPAIDFKTMLQSGLDGVDDRINAIKEKRGALDSKVKSDKELAKEALALGVKGEDKAAAKEEKLDDREFQAREREKDRALQRELLQTKQSETSVKPSVAEQAVDREFSKVYVEQIKGGSADAAKQINQLSDVIKELESTKNDTIQATGAISMVPKSIRDLFGARSSALQERVEEVVQRSLKAILGSQFTQKEGETLVKRAYNPAQSLEENMYRLNNLLNQLKEAKAAKDSAAQYFEENGTIKGFKGKIYQSVDDFNPDKGMDKQGKGDKKVQDYADQYFGGDYQKALELLKKRGYKGE